MAKTQVGNYTLEMPVIGGIPQAVVFSKDNPDLPLALMVHGGPGEPMTPHLDGLAQIAERFVLCVWDQRGCGKTYASAAPPESLTIDQFADDVVEVSKWLLEKYGRKKMYIFGLSWGSLISTLALKKAPELYYAYIGVGQIADQLRSEQIGYDFAMEHAKAAGDTKSVQQLEAVGRPSSETRYTMKDIMAERGVLRKYNESPGEKPNITAYFLKMFRCPFYTFSDKLNLLKGLNNSAPLFLDVMNRNLFKEIPELKVPYYVFEGKYDLQTVPEVAEAFVAALKAPKKEFCLFENAGHSVFDDEPEAFLAKVDRIVAENGK